METQADVPVVRHTGHWFRPEELTLVGNVIRSLDGQVVDPTEMPLEAEKEVASLYRAITGADSLAELRKDFDTSFEPPLYEPPLDGVAVGWEDGQAIRAAVTTERELGKAFAPLFRAVRYASDFLEAHWDPRLDWGIVMESGPVKLGHPETATDPSVPHVILVRWTLEKGFLWYDADHTEPKPVDNGTPLVALIAIVKAGIPAILKIFEKHRNALDSYEFTDIAGYIPFDGLLRALPVETEK